MSTWVVGSGGLLGRAVAAELRRRGTAVVTSAVPWNDPARAHEVLIAETDRFMASIGDAPWRLAWCAGAGVNGTTRDEFAGENALMARVLDEVARCAGSRAAHGVIFHASSAGGVYAGSPTAPYDERSPVAPLGDYGRAKLDAEAIVTEFGRRSGIPVIIGRFANLYGPGQNLAKPQGLISHLCRGYLTAAPVSIYVPMDTLRDYLYITDAAEMLADALSMKAPTEEVIKIFASGSAVTVGAILGACRTVFRRRPTVVLASSPLAAVQGRDLRLHSTVWTEIDRRTHRTLPAGISATLEATRGSLGIRPIGVSRARL